MGIFKRKKPLKTTVSLSDDKAKASYSFDTSGFNKQKINRFKKYGWDENDGPCEYKLLREFNEIIRVKFQELPLSSYVVPGNLLKELEKEITNNNRPSIEILQKIAYSMEEHLGFKGRKTVIRLNVEGEDGGVAGFHKTFLSTLSEITINYRIEYNEFNVIQILAHEISHAYQQYKNIFEYSNNESIMEKFTDALALYLGFSEAYKQGQHLKNSRLGYLNDATLIEIDKLVNERYVREEPIRKNYVEMLEIDKESKIVLENFKFQYESLKTFYFQVENKLTENSKNLLKAILDESYYNTVSEKLSKIYQYPKSEAKARINEVTHEILKLMNYNKWLESGLDKK